MEIRAGFLFLWKPLRLVVHASEGGEENNLFNIHGEKKILKQISAAQILDCFFSTDW